MQRDSEFLATEKPSKLLLKLALPAVTAQLVNMLYNIVDRMYIGRLEGIGTEAVSYTHLDVYKRQPVDSGEIPIELGYSWFSSK